MSSILKKAFTLIELLVVIAIIGILSALIVVTMNGVTDSAVRGKAQVFSNSLRNAIMMNLISEWKFDEGSGVTATDTWGNSATGTITGATYATGPSCVYGSCLALSGTAQYVTVAHGVTPVFTSKMTAFAWVKGAAQTNKAIVGQLDTNAQRSWMIYSGTGGALRVLLSADGAIVNSKDYITTVALPFDNKWRLVGFTFNAGTLSLYVDGVVAAVTQTVNGTCASLYDSTAALTMGCDLATGVQSNLFTGNLDEIRLYNETIPTAQIKEIYHAGLTNLLARGEISPEEYSQRIDNLSLNN